MSDWVPLHVHSHASLRRGLSKPAQIASRCKEIGVSACALTDHMVVGGTPGFFKEMKKAGVKGIAGTEMRICARDAADRSDENSFTHNLCVLATNPGGWKSLMRASSLSYQKEFDLDGPRLDLVRLAEFAKGNFIAFSGYLGSELADTLFELPRKVYAAKNLDEVRSLLRKDWKSRASECVRKHQELFGKDNFYVAIELIDQKNLPAALAVAKMLRVVAKELNVPRIAAANSYYQTREDSRDQRVVICSDLETTVSRVGGKLDSAKEPGLGKFFRSMNYHIPARDEMRELHSDHPEELANTVEIASRCESYSLGGPPLLPTFPCPGGMKPDDYLAELCRSGWQKKIAGKIPQRDWPKYEERLWKEEMPVIQGTDGFLSSYFLIMQDIIRYANEELGHKTGLGRGSSAGCLVSYLTGITRLDPLTFALSFERFYNAGRNVPGRIALPDIDTDFPIRAREKVIEYIRQKWGRDRVCQMATFSRMQGRGAMKDVLRVNERCDFETMNTITEHIPDEAAIADQLQLMMEETGEASIIQWALENNPEGLKEWAWLTEDGEVEGPLAFDFAQAIRLEGTKRNMSTHASGIVICSEPLSEICPMVRLKGGTEFITGVDMRDAEQLGLPKVDILGLRTLDCIEDAESIIRTGHAA